MGAYLLDWLSLFFRWFHVIAGVAWIGASFYFVWLDMSLQKPPEWKAKKGISGDLWAVHGGGFYEIAKYKLEPEEMPKTLHWFKWEAYTTWLTGMMMLIIVYYINATAYLIDPSKVDFGSSVGAISTSLLFLFGSYFIYEAIVRSSIGKNKLVFSVTIFILMIIATWGSYQLFSDRASFIHVGAILGTIMAGNVFFGIMPAQRALVDCVSRGVKPGPDVAALALMARNRSVMNNYFTLPLIFIMISNHYPMMYSHAHGWLVLVFVGIITATARHYFNEKHLGRNKPKFLVVPAIATVLLIIWMRPTPIEKSPTPAVSATAPAEDAAPTDTPPADGAEAEADAASNDENAAEAVPVSASADDAAMAIVHERCTTCHAVQPTHEMFNVPQAGIVLETPADLKTYKARIITAVQTEYMPFGNLTNMTDDERQQLLEYTSGL
ncbi:MAG: urate hydroxylase PuuD [Psychrobacter sp.]|uniref:urate hydroxylase PuuD n=1 Tax=unclassified Psychrobacter TaxID=196806 RepID=UPI001787AD04|nr:urate hydroxylase PuuD [Psychrobacter sp. FME5]MBE0443777.1 urate hydroxylase PuuD [Psychrobacter sp. FME5]MDN5801239.1 urate hydroxylase PuuD [Psychrobacter sp.]MDN5891590.1 urate hydroxylase PuuD [Psychrobacter sp.]